MKPPTIFQQLYINNKFHNLRTDPDRASLSHHCSSSTSSNNDLAGFVHTSAHAAHAHTRSLQP